MSRAMREFEAGADPRSRDREGYAYGLLVSDESLQKEKEREAERERIRDQLEALDKQAADMSTELEDLDRLYSGRKRPVLMQLEAINEQRESLLFELEVKQANEEEVIEPPGPKCLRWVDSTCFAALCNLLVTANLASMVLAPRYPQYEDLFHYADYVFLVWYCVELSVKYLYHQRNLFIGKISVVWWNWLDFLIVLSGILDQVIMPLLLHGHDAGGGLPISPSALRTLRFLRLFRILRFLKLVRAFLQGDMSWLQSSYFEVFMSAIIALNAITMSLELDYEWSGWIYVEHAFLTLYVFETSMKMKFAGLQFWIDRNEMLWNYLDFVIVSAGVADLWVMPAVRLFKTEVLNEEPQEGGGGGPLSMLPKLMRIFRIFRILRLIRLVKVIKPLYRLLLCIMEALQAMQWVLVLTLIMLYGGAIFWTTLVGKGLIFGGGDVPEEVEQSFGSVPESLFSLFRMMNGDTDNVHMLFSSEVGKLLFVGFMVLSNWAILAILTSVVSDNMISTSKYVLEEEEKKQDEKNYTERVRRLQAIFREIDTDSSGAISHKEWKALLKDEGLFHELHDATSLTKRDLVELFGCLAVEPSLDMEGRGKSPLDFFADPDQSPSAAAATDRSKVHRHQDVEDRIMYYSAFIEQLRDDSASADKRAVLKMMSRLQKLEDRLETRFDQMWGAMRSAFGQAITHDAPQGRLSAPGGGGGGGSGGRTS